MSGTVRMGCHAARCSRRSAGCDNSGGLQRWYRESSGSVWRPYYVGWVRSGRAQGGCSYPRPRMPPSSQPRVPKAP